MACLDAGDYQPLKPIGFEYQCDYCRVSIGRSVHIECAECEDIHLCLECFSYGKEMPPHENNHGYYVIEYISKPVFDDPKCKDWTGNQEIRLIDGIEKYGLGNWDNVASHVSQSKSGIQCQEHYVSMYVENKHLPSNFNNNNNNNNNCNKNNYNYNYNNEQKKNSSITKPSIRSSYYSNSNSNDNSSNSNNIRNSSGLNTVDNAMIFKDVQNLANPKRLPNELRTSDEARIEKLHKTNSKTTRFGSSSTTVNKRGNKWKLHKKYCNTFGNHFGYIPFRNEFDFEFLKKGENLIKDLIIDINDTQETKQVKLRVVEIYDKLLDLRDTYRECLIDWGCLHPDSGKNSRNSRNSKSNRNRNNRNTNNRNARNSNNSSSSNRNNTHSSNSRSSRRNNSRNHGNSNSSNSNSNSNNNVSRNDNSSFYSNFRFNSSGFSNSSDTQNESDSTTAQDTETRYIDDLRWLKKFFETPEIYTRKFLEPFHDITQRFDRLNEYLEMRKLGCRTWSDIDLYRDMKDEGTIGPLSTANSNNNNSNSNSNGNSVKNGGGSGDGLFGNKKVIDNINDAMKFNQVNGNVSMGLRTNSHDDHGDHWGGYGFDGFGDSGIGGGGGNNYNYNGNYNFDDISHEPGRLLLSQSERSLCESFSLLPRQYMQIKDIILMENMRLGFINEKEMCNLLKAIHVDKAKDMLQFFKDCGWIQLKK